jgi:hypothetical protein
MPANERSDPIASQHIELAYNQLCTSYHNIDDFRARLLGLLPLASGGGIALLASSPGGLPQSFLAPAGVFGFMIVFGLFLFELFGITKCAELIDQGKRLERRMGLSEAQFISRPQGIVGSLISEPWASAVVYSAVLASWSLLVTRSALGVAIAVVVFVIGSSCVIVFDISLVKKYSDR